MDIKYMLLYPAKLRVIYKGQSHFFEQPGEVWQWLDMTEQVPRHSLPDNGSYRSTQRRNRGPRRSGRSQGRSAMSPGEHFLVQEDGTISAAGGEQVLVPDTAPVRAAMEMGGTAPLRASEPAKPETGAAALLEALGT